MSKIKAVLVVNSVDNSGDLDKIREEQSVMKNPLVLMVRADNCDVVHVFEIVAESKEDLDRMWEDKVFRTSSIVEGSFMDIDGAMFYGTDKAAAC